ncbi:CinA family protein [Aliidiomarina sp. Khilg15.8]
MNTQLKQRVAELAKLLTLNNAMVGTAESCTGGGIAHAFTGVAGSSQWFNGSAVTYSNALKQKLLGVSASTLDLHGAVSQPVAEEMARGAQRLLDVDYALSVTGVAGPGGGSEQKPVGTVWFGWAGPKELYTEQRKFEGNRDSIREQATEYAIVKLINILKSNGY